MSYYRTYPKVFRQVNILDWRRRKKERQSEKELENFAPVIPTEEEKKLINERLAASYFYDHMGIILRDMTYRHLKEVPEDLMHMLSERNDGYAAVWQIKMMEASGDMPLDVLEWWVNNMPTMSFCRAELRGQLKLRKAQIEENSNGSNKEAKP